MRMIVAFEKTEQVRHLGHLDLMRAMQRALRRSGLAIRYSQGFNPHVLLSFASPLPVGVGGAEELMDVALDAAYDESSFAAMISAAMPPSLPLLWVRAIDDRHPKLMAQLTSAMYEALLPDDEASRAIAAAVQAFSAQPEIVALRKTKTREEKCDIRPMLLDLSASTTEDGVRLILRTALTERATLKPSLLLETLATYAGVNMPPVHYRRLRLYGGDGQQPVPLMEL